MSGGGGGGGGGGVDLIGGQQGTRGAVQSSPVPSEVQWWTLVEEVPGTGQ